MADTGIVECSSKLIADNFIPILEVLVEREKVNVKVPKNEKGRKRVIDIAHIFKQICKNYKGCTVEFYLTDNPIKYFTDSNAEKEYNIKIWPDSLQFKKITRVFTEFELVNESNYYDEIYLIGKKIDNTLRHKMHNDWWFMERFGDKLPEPVIKESMLSLYCDQNKAHDVGFYYYGYNSTFCLENFNISSKLSTSISDNAFNFLAKAVNFQIKAREINKAKRRSYGSSKRYKHYN